MKNEEVEFKPGELNELFGKLAEHLKKTENMLIDDEIKYPLQVDKLDCFALKPESERKAVGGWVKVRPVAKEYEGKTFLGIYLGDLPVGQMTTYNPDDKSMGIIFKRNPAMFIPDLKKIIYGMESWWGEISKPEDMKSITNKDIENVWYVKALKEMTSEKN